MFPIDPIIKQQLIDYIKFNKRLEYDELIFTIINDDHAVELIKAFIELATGIVDTFWCDKRIEICDMVNDKYEFLNINMEKLNITFEDCNDIVKMLDSPVLNFRKINNYDNKMIVNLGNDIYLYFNNTFTLIYGLEEKLQHLKSQKI
jgi:hypothetical protein